jgi:malonate transporter
VTGVLTGFSIIAVVIAVGYAAGRFGIAGENARQVFSRTAFFVTNPALLFTVIAQADVREIFSSFVLIALIAAATVAAVYIAASRLFFRRPAAETAIGAMSAFYVNANNIGIPVAIYVLGDAAFVAPVILLQMLVFTPISLSILDLTSGARISVVSILTQPVRNPVIIASVLGVIVAACGLDLPAPVLAPLELLGGAAVPLVLMAFGMSLHGMRPFRAGSGRTEIVVATLLKSVAMPAVAYLVARFGFGAAGHDLFGAVVMAALPAAQNVFLFASRYDRGVAVARDVVLLSSVAAIPALVGIAALLA